MKLLLHACCGPCSLEPVRSLRAAGHDITIYYANSNIAPTEEYAHRLTTILTWANQENISIVEGFYEPAAWEASAGRIGDAALAEAKPENNKPPILTVNPEQRKARCQACYRLRFEETAMVAANKGYDAIGTTLSVSPYQYTEIIHEELSRAAARFGVGVVFEDYRPLYNEATRRSKELGMYRQNYCGCRLSQAEAAAERAERKREREAAREAERAAHANERAAEEAERKAKRDERAAYDAKQANKRAVLKALREQTRQ